MVSAEKPLGHQSGHARRTYRMLGGQYFNFDIAFGPYLPGTTFAPLTVTSSVGELTASFQTPEMPHDLDALFRGHSGPIFDEKQLEDEKLSALKETGKSLLQALFYDRQIETAFRDAQDHAAKNQGSMRIRLFLSKAPSLGLLPWEFLFDPSVNQFLSLSKDTPIVRYLMSPAPIRPFALERPLRILIVMPSPSDAFRFDLEGEWNGITEALNDRLLRQDVTLERLAPPTIPALRRRLRQDPPVHVFHFAGHGGFDVEDRTGVIFFEDGAGKAQLVRGEDIGMLLGDLQSLRLAVLNSARGAVYDPAQPFGGVAQAIVAAGLPAVVAYQGEVTDTGAVTFASELYAGLAEGLPLEAALTEARRAMRFGHGPLEWGVPVLYSRSEDGRLFDIAGRPPSPVLTQVPKSSQETGELLAAAVGRSSSTGEPRVETEAPSIEAVRSTQRELALPLSETPMILILSANPPGTTTLRLDEEQRSIQEELDRSEVGRLFRVESRPAVRYGDIQYLVLKTTPTILHFSGHGEVPGIFVEDEATKPHLVPGDALAGLLGERIVRESLRLVVLNACWSADQAEAISSRLFGAVVGMSHRVSDRAAIEFAHGLYGALGNPRVSLAEAFRLASNRVAIAGNLDETETPQLFVSPGIDLEAIYLVRRPPGTSKADS